MTITTSGPEGYDFQYLVTLYLLLLLNKEGKIEVYVEKENGEDATFLYSKNSQNITINLQVKGEEGDLDIQKLTGWLNHFEPQKTDVNLISKLYLNKNENLIIATRTRCTDNTKMLRSKLGELTRKKTGSFKKTQVVEFKKSLSRYKTSNKTNTNQKRNDFAKTITNEIFSKTQNISEVFSRIVVWEGIDKSDLVYRVERILNLDFNIPQSLTSKVILELIEIIRQFRGKGINIVTQVIEKINKNKSDRPIFDNYILRRDESELFGYIEDNNILLLSGISFCGKSLTSKYIAEKYYNKGYNFKLGDNINEAVRYLKDTIVEDRIYLLDDPFGHELKSDSQAILNKLGEIIVNLPKNRKLIVTSRRDVLLHLQSTDDLNNCKINNIKWFDLTVTDKQYLIKLWNSYSKAKNVPRKVSKLIAEYLANVIEIEGLLQPGQLYYLSSCEHSLLLNKSIDELYHIASPDSKEIGTYLSKRSKECSEILIALTLTTNNVMPISFVELEYVLSKSDTRPGYIKDSSIRAFSVRDENIKETFPVYEENYQLNKLHKFEMGYLQERGIIEISNNKIIFKHPVYLESGRYICLVERIDNLEIMIEYLDRGLFSLNYYTSLICTNSFNFLFRNIKDEDFKQKLIVLAIKGLNSIFPAVRDKCVIFLINNISFLNDELKSIVFSHMEFNYRVYDFNWHNKIPYISTHARSHFLDYLFKPQINEQNITKLIFDLKSNNYVSVEDAWDLIQSTKKNHALILEEIIVKRLLNFQEVFIREEIAYLYLKNLTGKISDNLFRVFNDEHPSVVCAGIRGAFNGWITYSEDIKKTLLMLIKRSLKNENVVFRINVFMTQFAKEHEEESLDWEEMNEQQKREIWKVWSILFPIFFNKTNDYARLHTARFGYTLDESTKYLNPEDGVKVAKSWFKWINNKQKKYELDSYELFIADYLILVTKRKPILRLTLMRKILKHRDTNLLTSSINWLIIEWANLLNEEKSMIINLLKSRRHDKRWLLAVALVRENVPPIITIEIFNDEHLLYKSPAEIINTIPEQLLQDCLSIYCGYPQPLWWLGYHHNGKNVWLNVMKYILRNTYTIGFRISLREMITSRLNGDVVDWSDALDIWRNLCANKENDFREILFTELLKCTICIVSSQKEEFWSIFFEKFGYLESEIEQILRNVEAIESTELLYETFGYSFLENHIFPKLLVDYKLMEFVYYLLETKTPMNDNIEQLMKSIFNSSPPRLRSTCQYSINVLKNVPGSEKIIGLIENRRRELIEIGHKQASSFDDNYDLENWISLFMNN